MDAAGTEARIPPRRLAEFEDYTTYFGARLYPRVGNLALLGVVFLVGFSALDWLYTRGGENFAPMILCRATAVVLLAAAALVMRRQTSGFGPARAMLILGILSFLFLTVNYIVFTRHLELVAFTLVFYLFGLHALAPLLKIGEYVAASVLTLAAVALLMEIPDLRAVDYGTAGLFAVPLQVFLGAAIVASQEAAREQYRIAQENYYFSTLDTLTQLLNRRTWYEKAEARVVDRRRAVGSASFLMLDIDHLKQVNDTWGHACGDEVIRAVSATLVAETRGGDLVGRLGGEEFGVFLPDTDPQGARETAERIRRAIESRPVVFGGASLAVTVSIGVTSTATGSLDLEALIHQGDRCLYQAKHGGRNRVVADTPGGMVGIS